MPHYLQPSLFPECAYAAVRSSNPGHEDSYRPECELCQWIGSSTTSRATAEFRVYVHNESHHAN